LPFVTTDFKPRWQITSEESAKIAMTRLLLFLFVFFLSFAKIYATHNVAGEITYKAVIDPSHTDCHTYDITITTYTDMTSQADRCSLELFFGDGSSAWINRDNGVASTASLCATGLGGIPVGPNYPNYKKNTYTTRHTYPGAFTYVISMKDPNRITGICNIFNSVNVQFYLQSVLVINDILGCNGSSPQLTTPPLDLACPLHCFYHNPGAFDPDGDSLHYALSPCFDTTQSPLAGWSALPVTPGGSVSIDPVSGLLTWCSPPDACIYNICIRIEKWRNKFGHHYFMGYVLRDMEIISTPCSNVNPILSEPRDTCVLAGTVLKFTVTGSAPTIAADSLNLSGSGDVFNVTAPIAIFPPLPSSTGFAIGPITGTFSWNTTCDHIRKQAHQATFRLENFPKNNNTHLLDYETVYITVIAPAPKAIWASPAGQTIKLHWDPELCNPPSNGFVHYEIFRRIGCDTLTPAHCTTGVPSAWGYTLIGTTTNGLIFDTLFTDNNGGAGLIPGITYSYRVVALYSDGAESQPSPNACAGLKRDIPVITNVDVDQTDVAAGVIFVRWKNAIPNKGAFTLGLDTNATPGPYILKIYRSSGFVLAKPVLVHTFTSNFIYNLDSNFIDNTKPLDTQDSAWSYRVDFYGSSPSILLGSTQRASSVYLNLTPSDKKLTLTWQENVPWTNFKYTIFKETAASVWTQVGTSIVPTFADSNLINGHVYCYYVTSYGSYFNPTLSDTLLNRSQRACKAPKDLSPPCAPQLQLFSDCENFQNTLVWTDPNHHCSDDVVTYNIWYAPTGNDPLSPLQTVTVSNDTVLIFKDLASVAGCYAVSALDTFLNQSVLSNVVCADNCPYYALPNVFSPNGDNINDVYHALPYRYVKSVDMKIYDRWGVLLFKTTDPQINWDGKSLQGGKLCSDGVYYYICIVNEERLIGIVPHQLKGFIQLISTPEPNR
jgi:gliding motility-associated-like protein